MQILLDDSNLDVINLIGIEFGSYLNQKDIFKYRIIYLTDIDFIYASCIDDTILLPTGDKLNAISFLIGVALLFY
jgi:hypothetical protein